MCWKTCSATWNDHVLHCRGFFCFLPPMPTLYMCTRGIPTRPPGHPERRRLRVASSLHTKASSSSSHILFPAGVEALVRSRLQIATQVICSFDLH